MSDMRRELAEIVKANCAQANDWEADGIAVSVLAALPDMVPELEFVTNNHKQRWARTGPLSYGYWQRSDGSWYVMSNNDSNLCGDEEAVILWANTTHRQQLMKALGLA